MFLYAGDAYLAASSLGPSLEIHVAGLRNKGGGGEPGDEASRLYSYILLLYNVTCTILSSSMNMYICAVDCRTDTDIFSTLW